MGLQRITVYADADDLAVIKGAARREGVTAAEIIREAVHLAALSMRASDESLFGEADPEAGAESGGSNRSGDARA